ncbi:hypothetical protein EDE08_1261 [Bradyrhizobium sp. R2.2-H]|jgi:hypothetical protein|uniref:hypothetical protein n=1 Tax=unclassified Bradyrhizobium TaxID=2631580 RepID=UPI001042EB52|nr:MULTISPECIES: hypothetical protein [unclassified Bradyrhizobium]TCU60312.1 hypothetical protein EDE10_12659 [Bradyrhizobium sp. Y-H1]TCU63892.1 hypothetical protein EDE08_1261 [Bradyrhizobium sp. R2.2-H]
MFVQENQDLIAEELGIEVEELEQLRYDEGEHASEDGLIYYFYVTFKDGNPPAIMKKIQGLEGKMVRFDPSLFEG